MLAFEWDALRPGDRVSVHDDQAPNFATHHGVVTSIQRHRDGASDVGVRLDDTASVVRPRRHAVHLLPLDRSECWRCGVAHGGAADRRTAPPT